MSEMMVKARPVREPTHPGAILREDVIPALDVSVTEFARCLGISRGLLHAILAEKKPISPETALRLGRLLDVSPESWSRMQLAYDIWHAENRIRDDLAEIEAIRAA